jgi:hypothetical protein
LDQNRLFQILSSSFIILSFIAIVTESAVEHSAKEKSETVLIHYKSSPWVHGFADQSDRAVYSVNSLLSHKHRDRRFESNLKHKLLCVFILFVFSCVQVVVLKIVDSPAKVQQKAVQRYIDRQIDR